MRDSLASLIIANVFCVGAFLSVGDMFNWIILLILSFVWFVRYLIEAHGEIEVLKRKIRIQKRMLYNEFIKECREASIKEFQKKKVVRKKKK